MDYIKRKKPLSSKNALKNQFNIVWYVVCWNEMRILPFIVKYWEQIARKVIVYDDHSTDGTREYLSTFDWIEIRDFPMNTNGQLRDDINQEIKSNCWKEQQGKGIDYVIISDVDEVIWAKNEISLISEFNFYENSHFSIIHPACYEFGSEQFPQYNEGLLHEQVTRCKRNYGYDKPMIIAPDLVSDMKYVPGCHWLEYANTKECSWRSGSLYMFHFKYLGLNYVLDRKHSIQARMSQLNKDNGWGIQYYEDDKFVVGMYDDMMRSKLNIRDVLSK